MGEEKKEINSSSLLVHFDIRVRLYTIPNTINEEGANLKIRITNRALNIKWRPKTCKIPEQ